MKSLGLVHDFFELSAFPLSPLLACDAGVNRLDDEPFSLRWIRGKGKTSPQEAIDRLLHRFLRDAILLFKEAGYVVVDGQRGAHIMMLRCEAS